MYVYVYTCNFLNQVHKNKTVTVLRILLLNTFISRIVHLIVQNLEVKIYVV